MPLIASHQVVCAGRIGTFQEYIVVGIGCYFKAPGWRHEIAAILDKLQQLLTKPLANLQLRPAEHFAVLLQDRPGHVKACWSAQGKQQNGALQPGRLDGSGDYYIRVDYQTEGKHYRCGFRERDALMIRSIWREVNALVRFRSASSPMILNTSGSGAASLT
jgi:hypothetical protein